MSVIDEIEGMAQARPGTGMAQAAGASLFVLSAFGVLWAIGAVVPAAAFLAMWAAVWRPLFGLPEIDFWQAYFAAASLFVVGVFTWIPVALIGHFWKSIVKQGEEE